MAATLEAQSLHRATSSLLINLQMNLHHSFYPGREGRGVIPRCVPAGARVKQTASGTGRETSEHRCPLRLFMDFFPLLLCREGPAASHHLARTPQRRQSGSNKPQTPQIATPAPGFACEDTGEGREKTGVWGDAGVARAGHRQQLQPSEGGPTAAAPLGPALLLFIGALGVCQVSQSSDADLHINEMS